MKVAYMRLQYEKAGKAEIDGILKSFNEELVKFSHKRLESDRLLKWVATFVTFMSTLATRATMKAPKWLWDCINLFRVERI